MQCHSNVGAATPVWAVSSACQRRSAAAPRFYHAIGELVHNLGHNRTVNKKLTLNNLWDKHYLVTDLQRQEQGIGFRSLAGLGLLTPI